MEMTWENLESFEQSYNLISSVRGDPATRITMNNDIEKKGTKYILKYLQLREHVFNRVFVLLLLSNVLDGEMLTKN